MTQVSRGRRNMGVKTQARVEGVLQAPVRVAPAQRASVDREALWDRMDAHDLSQNETARRAGISPVLLSRIMNGKATPSGKVLGKLHRVLFQPTQAELVVPAEVKVLAWKKGGRNGVVVRGAGGPGAGSQVGGGTLRIGGRVPWGTEVEYAYRAGYDSRGRVSVTHVVDERGYSVMLTQREPDGVWHNARRRNRLPLTGYGEQRERQTEPVITVPFRVGAGRRARTGEGTGRRGPPDRSNEGKATVPLAVAFPVFQLYAYMAYFAFQHFYARSRAVQRGLTDVGAPREYAQGEACCPSKRPFGHWCRLPVFQHSLRVLRLHHW